MSETMQEVACSPKTSLCPSLDPGVLATAEGFPTTLLESLRQMYAEAPLTRLALLRNELVAWMTRGAQLQAELDVLIKELSSASEFGVHGWGDSVVDLMTENPFKGQPECDQEVTEMQTTLSELDPAKEMSSNLEEVDGLVMPPPPEDVHLPPDPELDNAIGDDIVLYSSRLASVPDTPLPHYDENY